MVSLFASRPRKQPQETARSLSPDMRQLKESNMCQDHCEAGVHHHQATIRDWQRAWQTSKVEPIPLEPVDRLMITCLIDNVVDPLAVNEGKLSGLGQTA
jgi:hypothetical protein